MNIEFHYYTIYFLAIKAGFDPGDSFIMAHSSQFVDHNLISWSISTSEGDYKGIPTQNYGFWDDSFPREVYIPLHFFPAGNDQDKSLRKDGKFNPYNCAANSENVKKLLIDALQTKNLYRIGIALHTFADSYAHQNFSGKLENWNIISDSNIIPAIGHAQAIKKPDDPTLVWQDLRLAGEHKKINNLERCSDAVRKIYRYLCLYTGKSYDDEEFILDDYKQIMDGGSRRKEGRERILDFIIAGEIPKYSRTVWIDQAIRDFTDIRDEKMYNGYSRFLWLMDSLLYKTSILKPRQYIARENFHESHFYHWQEAAKKHIEDAWEILSDLDQ